MSRTVSVHESEVSRKEHPDRWSKDLVGGAEPATTSGFCIGVAEYHVAEFGELQTHDDQEALYVLSGVGEVRVGDEAVAVRPGTALYVGPGVPHATRRTGDAPVRLLYAHGAV